MFGANLVILAQICDELSHGQAKFPRILSQMTKMTLKVTVNDLHFQYQPRLSQDACLGQIWWFQLNPVTIYRADKIKLTGGQTDGRTDRRRQRQHPFGLKVHGVKKRILACLYTYWDLRTPAILFQTDRLTTPGWRPNSTHWTISGNVF